MISQTTSRTHRPALTSNRWHVVHARWSGAGEDGHRFVRTIVSEHEDRERATESARKLADRLGDEMRRRPRHERDQLFIRKPGFKSLAAAGRVRRRRR